MPYPKLSKRLKNYDVSGFATPAYNALRTKLVDENHKVINFVVGDPVRARDFETPEIIRKALAEMTSRPDAFRYEEYAGTQPYEGSPSTHVITKEFKEAAIRREKIVHGVEYEPGNVFPSTGALGGIHLFYYSVAEREDDWLCCEPIYANYWAVHGYPEFGFNWLGFKQDEEKNWTPDLEELRSKITKKTRVISMVNPCNPTGAVFGEKTLRGIIDIAGENELLVQVDQVMDLLMHDGSISTSIAKVAGDVPTIILNSFSKSMLCPGFRLGWVCISDPEDKILEIRKNILRSQRVADTRPAPPLQMAGTKVLNEMNDFQNHLRPFIEKIRKRAAYGQKRIGEIDGLSMVPIKAGYWGYAKYEGLGTVWKNDTEMAFDLLEFGGGDKGVAVTGGSTWGSTYGVGHFRIPALWSEDILEEGFDRLQEFFRLRLK